MQSDAVALMVGESAMLMPAGEVWVSGVFGLGCLAAWSVAIWLWREQRRRFAVIQHDTEFLQGQCREVTTALESHSQQCERDLAKNGPVMELAQAVETLGQRVESLERELAACLAARTAPAVAPVPTVMSGRPANAVPVEPRGERMGTGVSTPTPPVNAPEPEPVLLERLILDAAPAGEIVGELERLGRQAAPELREALDEVAAWITWLETKREVLFELSDSDLVDRLLVWYRNLDYYISADPTEDPSFAVLGDGVVQVDPQVLHVLEKRLQVRQQEYRGFLRNHGIERIEAAPGEAFTPGVVERSNRSAEPTDDPNLHDRVYRVEPGEGGYRNHDRILSYSLARRYEYTGPSSGSS